jgi:pyruvate-ferredoxin/flavodoxin oxidoreductase
VRCPSHGRQIAVLDRTKEPGAMGEPLYQDVSPRWPRPTGGILKTDGVPKVIGGIYGLSSKEFTPAMVKAVLDEQDKERPEAALHGRHRGRRDPPVARL